MKNKIKFYFTRAFFDGMFFALSLVNTTQAFVDRRGWFSCAIWILLTLFWIGIIYIDFRNANKLTTEIDKVESEDTSILGAQLYGKAKLEKTIRDAEVKDEQKKND